MINFSKISQRRKILLSGKNLKFHISVNLLNTETIYKIDTKSLVGGRSINYINSIQYYIVNKNIF